MNQNATRSLRYAFRRDLVVLYGLFLLGVIIQSWFSLPGFYAPLDELLHSLLDVAGLALAMGSLVAILHNVVSDLVPE